MRKYLSVIALLPLLAAAQTFDADTIGGTIYDWCNGPAYRCVFNDTGFGIHTLIMFCADPSTSDRNMRYNFYDYATSQWALSIGPDFMTWGINGFGVRAGYGSLDVGPNSHNAYFSAHCGSIYPTCVRDQSPGSGTFEECSGQATADQYLWPPIAITSDEKVHVALVDNSTTNGLFYSRIDPWCTWSVPVSITEGNDPQFSDQFIEASKQSNNVLISWIVNVDPAPFFYRLSTDGGDNWDPVTEIPVPETYTPGSETTASYSISGNSLLWDNSDQFHIAVNVMPIVGGTGYIIPTEIWHYCPTNTPPWNKITRATCDTGHLGGSVGSNALYAGRPMLAIDKYNRLFCIWEQFDSLNLESATGQIRADIYGAGSTDNGVTWSQPVRLTAPDSTSHRFPCVARVADDFIHVLYLRDLMAGSFINSEGDMTNSPYVYLKVPVTALLGVAEAPARQRGFVPRLAVAPNPFAASTHISYELNRAGSAALRIYDASGNRVKTLVNGNLPAGRGTATWSGTDDRQRPVPRGIYFARLETTGRVISQKIVFTR
jgi:hypothetical protein